MNRTLTVYRGEEKLLLTALQGESLLQALSRGGIPVSAPCGGHGKCGNCRVRYRAGGEWRWVLCCQTEVVEDAELCLPEHDAGGLTDFAREAWQNGEDLLGAAVDIGTTTVAASLVRCADGQILESRAVLNPQRAYGADVISRITACAAGNLRIQTDLIRRAVAELLTCLCEERGECRIDRVTVCGNPTMLHLFCGVDPAPIGVYPFTPVFCNLREFSGEELGLFAERVFVLPSVSGYLGADAVCGILSRRLTDGGVRMLADLGTNGELMLWDGRTIYAASTAAGPALEGAGLECGIGGVPGAVCAVSRDREGLRLETVEHLPPVGICGSGLVDLIALLLDCGLLDEAGNFDETARHPLSDRLRDEKFHLTDTVYLSQRDVRQFQLAKAAISAAILTLCRFAGVEPQAVRSLEIAGGLGFYLREQSALRTGLIPAPFAGHIAAVGNTGLAGAVRCLLTPERVRAEKLAGQVRVCELNEQSDFTELFISNMTFDAQTEEAL